MPLIHGRTGLALMGGSTGRARPKPPGIQREKRKPKDNRPELAGRTGVLGQTRQLLTHKLLVVETSGWGESAPRGHSLTPGAHQQPRVVK
eukprot:743937-Amphidinium_carterae.1